MTPAVVAHSCVPHAAYGRGTGWLFDGGGPGIGEVALVTAGRDALSIWRHRSLAWAGDSASTRAACSSCVLVTRYRRRIMRRLESFIVTSSALSDCTRRSSRSALTNVESVMPSLGEPRLRQPPAQAQMRVTATAQRVRIMRARLGTRRRKVNAVPC